MMSFIHKVHGKPTYYLKDGRHVARLHRRRRRRRAHPRAIPLAMITMKKSIHGFPLLSMGIGLRLAAFGRLSSAITGKGMYDCHASGHRQACSRINEEKMQR